MCHCNSDKFPSILSACIASLQLFKRVEGNNYIEVSSQFATLVMPYFSSVSGSMGRYMSSSSKARYALLSISN